LGVLYLGFGSFKKSDLVGLRFVYSNFFLFVVKICFKDLDAVVIEHFGLDDLFVFTVKRDIAYWVIKGIWGMGLQLDEIDSV
jgi:hypothetical protein